MSASDPRVYFAAERTLLAWVRTGISVVALGFVVARFGLFLRVVQPASRHGNSGLSTALGTILVVLGALFTGMAAVQFIAFLRTLAPAEQPPSPRMAWYGPLVALAVSAIAVVLAVYLVT